MAWGWADEVLRGGRWGVGLCGKSELYGLRVRCFTVSSVPQGPTLQLAFFTQLHPS